MPHHWCILSYYVYLNCKCPVIAVHQYEQNPQAKTNQFKNFNRLWFFNLSALWGKMRDKLGTKGEWVSSEYHIKEIFIFFLFKQMEEWNTSHKDSVESALPLSKPHPPLVIFNAKYSNIYILFEPLEWIYCYIKRMRKRERGRDFISQDTICYLLLFFCCSYGMELWSAVAYERPLYARSLLYNCLS